MARFINTSSFQHQSSAQIGLLLVNLGTPDQCDTPSVRRYLKEFLSDPRVVEIPAAIWQCILYSAILPFRSPQSAEKYAKIWTPQGSPLLINSHKQAQLLKGYLGEKLRTLQLPSDLVNIQLAMRYGTPSISEALDTLRAAGCQKVLCLPLYPQYAASTTASVHDKVFNILQHWRWQPALRTVSTYHDFPPYIQALAQCIRRYWNQYGRGDTLIMSFHGVPQFTLEKGDPYFCFCQKTARLLAETLQLEEHQYRISFQSRFGRAEWLQPYTVTTLQELGKNGTTRVDVVCPGFVSDCLETLEEIAIEGKKEFLTTGGKEFHYIPALNDEPAWIDALTQLCMQELGGWLNPPPSKEDIQATQNRVQKLNTSNAKPANHS